ncbi:MAG: CC0125/CC1285 family lipoprotein [Endozoicomonas sp.]|uniref:CC0125/CC1285 family lipoprotein n=1 Tax=Endozoicomonas sp. TaxID=1892382 RepID=UPI003D9ADEDE
MKKLVVIALAAVLTGCVSYTKYGPYGKGGGYTEVQVNETVFEITAIVNFKTHSSTARDYALARSAQLACKHGYPYFEVIDQETTLNTGRRSADHFTTSRLTIKLQPTSNDQYYNARILYDNMKKNYQLPSICG